MKERSGEQLYADVADVEWILHGEQRPADLQNICRTLLGRKDERNAELLCMKFARRMAYHIDSRWERRESTDEAEAVGVVRRIGWGNGRQQASKKSIQMRREMKSRRRQHDDDGWTGWAANSTRATQAQAEMRKVQSVQIDESNEWMLAGFLHLTQAAHLIIVVVSSSPSRFVLFSPVSPCPKTWRFKHLDCAFK